ncbi:hypothetical protein B0H67DRAFT_645942 [Lasiosphaeris hirsuta]|uniref:Exonuclease domain-containing protein n=1 Tax=Lasiosphaeris hirsuta TaxID=260670 RepID=A0AA40DWL9_9PEZI|nr:hypothetical protein B0H67DRAFT_645942 [Lasiosphaeris hirsuta]
MDASNFPPKYAEANVCFPYLEKQRWSCCGKHVSENPCGGDNNHLLRHDPGDRALKKSWEFDETPTHARPDHRLAVSIDCEMGSASDNELELIRLTVVDYFSGKTLIDTLMERAWKRRQCIFGTAAASVAIFKYVGRGTFVVGHGMQHDLLCLRWHHNRIVDSYLIESAIGKEEQMRVEEERKKGGIEAASSLLERGQAKDGPERGKRHPDGMSLKALALKKLGRSIQEGEGHDSLEDAVAARDLAHSYVAVGQCPVLDSHHAGKHQAVTQAKKPEIERSLEAH